MYGRKLILTVMTALCLMAVIYISENITVFKDKETVESSNVVYYEKEVALTFDDGPGGKSTARLLEELKKRDVRATFFVVGEKIEGNEDLIKQMYDDGHIIGNHTFTHTILTSIPKEKAFEEIYKTNELIEEITGERVKYIRPPCGNWDKEMLYEIDMTPVFWSVDPLDWRTENVTAVVNSVVEDVNDGDVILFHDIYESSVTAAIEVVDRLQAQGYVFVTIDEILIE